MIAQYRPEIARVAEQTVLGLKELETRLELLKNDLAALCTAVGHPPAAQLAVTPTRLLGGPVIAPFGVAHAGPIGALGAPSPFATPVAAPWAANPLATPFASVPGAPVLGGFPGIGSPGGVGAFSPGFAGVGAPLFP